MARSRSFPPVSARSGKPADGYAQAGPKVQGVLVPLTQAEFDRVQYLRRRQRSAKYGGFACVAVGLALARFPVILPLGVVIGLLSGALWTVANFAINAYLPGIDVDEDRGKVELTRVHKRFVAAVTKASS
jgi:hypothetical protein